MEEEGVRKRSPPTSKNLQPVKKKVKLESRKKKSSFDNEIFNETTYYIKDGLRYVKPYYFTFTTHAKGRWVGSTVYDVFCREFQAESPEYYKTAITNGKVTVNDKVATMDMVICHNDLICHRVHRHEPPVTAQELTFIHKDEDLVVINKPASIPIHPCGRYRHNSIVFLLAKEYALKNLHVVHRLDRLTSGLLIMARSVRRAQQLGTEIRDRKVLKEYVCRVQGEFPRNPIECTQPILVVSHKLGLSRVDPMGKPCTTHFTSLSYDGRSSVVKCVPKTGRMHQIRVHLQWLGHPILNDPLYNHLGGGDNGSGGGGMGGRDDSSGGGGVSGGDDSSGGDEMGGDLARISEPCHATEKINKCLKEKGGNELDKGQEKDIHRMCLETSKDKEEKEGTCSGDIKESPTNDFDSSYDKDCTECQLRSPPSPKELTMYLHALSYKGEDWSFSTPMPPWADKDQKQ